MKLFKKTIALVMAAGLALTALTGCQKQKAIDNSEIVMTVGDKKVELGMANFLARYQQPEGEYMLDMYAAYGYAMDWSTEVEEGKTYEESVKEGVLETLQDFYILEAHAEEYNVALTEDELAKIDEAAAAFKEANTEEVYERVSGEYAAEYFKLITIYEKVQDAIKANVDTEVDEAEVNQKIMYYVEYATTTTDDAGTETAMSEDEIAAVKADAQAFLDAAKANGSLSTYASENEVEAVEEAFNVNDEDIDSALLTAADALELNGFTDVIVGESAIYVAQVTSLFDQEATDEAIDAVIEERETELFNTTLEEWKEATEIKVYDKVWAKVSLDDLKVNSITPEEETDDTTTDDTATDETAE